jgi:rod shape-determining protein MreD
VFYLKIIVVIAVAVVLQGFGPRFWSPFRFVDLALLVTIYFALMRDPVTGMVTGYVAGFGSDLGSASGPILGVGGFSKTVIGFLIASVAVRFTLEGPLVRIVVIALSTLVDRAMFVGLHAMVGMSLTDETTPQVLAMKFLFSAAANVVLGVILFWILDRVFPEQSKRGQMRVQRRFYD